MAASAKETKALLKNARECIKNKEYKEALKHCKVFNDLSPACCWNWKIGLLINFEIDMTFSDSLISCGFPCCWGNVNIFYNFFSIISSFSCKLSAFLAFLLPLPSYPHPCPLRSSEPLLVKYTGEFISDKPNTCFKIHACHKEIIKLLE